MIHLGISDHSMVFAVKSTTVPKFRQSTKEVRDYKNFVDSNFIDDISQVPWDIVCQFDDPNTCWHAWKSLFLEILDRHAPVRCKRTSSALVPWITSNLKRLMWNRDYHKKQAMKHASSAHWNIYKTERNRVNVAMRSAKKVYFHDKIKECSQCGNVKKSWNLINTLLNRNKKATNVDELHINDSVIVDDKQIADAFNEYFVQIGPKLAAEIGDLTSQHTNGLDGSCPNSYFAPRFVFSQISQINVATSLRRLKVSKATGMDSIPAKILKMSVDIHNSTIFNCHLQFIS